MAVELIYKTTTNKFWNDAEILLHLQVMNGVEPYSRIELVDKREYQKAYMKPTLDWVGFKRQKASWFLDKNWVIPVIVHERESKNTVVWNRALSFSWQVWFSESFAADSSTTFFALSLKALVGFLGGYTIARLAPAKKRPKCELILLLYFDVCTTYGP